MLRHDRSALHDRCCNLVLAADRTCRRRRTGGRSARGPVVLGLPRDVELRQNYGAALVGRDPAAIVAAMQGFRAGTIPGTVMDRIAKGFSDDEVKAIAAWYGAQKN